MSFKKHALLDDDAPSSVLPEVEIFAYLLVLTFLVDQKEFTQVRVLSDLRQLLSC